MSVCVLYRVCNLHFIPSLHFILTVSVIVSCLQSSYKTAVILKLGPKGLLKMCLKYCTAIKIDKLKHSLKSSEV